MKDWNCVVTGYRVIGAGITHACAGTHPSKFTCVIYRTCKIIVFSLRRNFTLSIVIVFIYT